MNLKRRIRQILTQPREIRLQQFKEAVAHMEETMTPEEMRLFVKFPCGPRMLAEQRKRRLSGNGG